MPFAKKFRAMMDFPTTFSGYGNPYQLWFRKPEIESLGNQRYVVNVKGSEARMYLEPELARFLQYLDDHHHLAAPSDPADRETLVEAYLDQYRAEIALLVARYHWCCASSPTRMPTCAA